MNKPLTVFLLISTPCFLFSCVQTGNPEPQQADLVSAGHYVSADGMWRTSPETAHRFPHGKLEYLMQIRGSVSGKISAQGCLLWNGDFYDTWRFDRIRFSDSSGRLLIVDEEGSTYTGSVDRDNRTIHGTICFGGDEDADTLDFVRYDGADAGNFFNPRPPRADGSIVYTYRRPETCPDQLQTASIFNYITDTAALCSLIGTIIRQKSGHIESILIAKDNNLVLEEYFFGYDRQRKHRINSCSKSITSLLLGISLGKHNKLNPGQPLFDFFPECAHLKSTEKENIRLEHVLTMTAGISADDDFNVREPAEFPAVLLARPLSTAPGEQFEYNNNCTNLLGSIIYSLEHMQADEFAEKELFNRLGITEYDWEKENGRVLCHNGLSMTPRSMTAIGLLVLNRGAWNGRQLVPEAWIDASAKPLVSESSFFDYGYQWWYRSRRNKPWWDNPVHGGRDEHDMILALGYGGQFIMVIPDLDLVVTVTASDNNEQNGLWLTKVPMVIEEVVPLFDR